MQSVSYCLKVFVVLRVAVTLVALGSVSVIPQNDVSDVPGWPSPEPRAGWSNAVTSLERWDALWFLRIADDGYEAADGSAAFFPLYPLAARAAGAGGHPLAGATLVANAAALIALVVCYRLTRLEYDDATARRTVLLVALFPTSFFLLAPYSEALFLALALGCVLCARKRRWLAAGGLGALAAATRSIGIVLVPALVVEAVHQHVERRRSDGLRGRRAAAALLVSVAGALLPAAGTLAYAAYWQVRAGDALVPVSEQANWQREFSIPLVTILDGTLAAFRFLGVPNGGYALLDWLVVVPVLVATAWACLRARPVHAVYAALSIAVPLTFIFEARPFMSLPRFALVVWPLFWGFSRLVARAPARELYAGCSALGLGVFLLLFVNWYWIF